MISEKTVTKLQKILDIAEDDKMSRTDFLNAFEQVVKIVLTLKQQNMNEIGGLKTAFERIKNLLKEGNTTDFDSLRSQIKNDIGMLSSKLEQKSKQIDDKIASIKDGKDADENAVRDAVLASIKLPEYRAPIMPGPEETQDMLEMITEEKDKLRIEAIGFLKKKLDDLEQKINERVGGGRVGWGAHPLMIQDSGAVQSKVARVINFGTNLTATTAPDGVITVNASGGSGLSVLTATGTIDDSNTTFTFASAPTFVVVNGAMYRNGSGVTIVGTTATLDNPVGTGGSIFGLG